MAAHLTFSNPNAQAEPAGGLVSPCRIATWARSSPSARRNEHCVWVPTSAPFGEQWRFALLSQDLLLLRSDTVQLEFGLLVGKVLADAVADSDGASFQLQHAHDHAVDVEHDVGPPLQVAFEGYLFDDGKIIFGWVFPVDEVYGLRDLTRLGLSSRRDSDSPAHGGSGQ